jgi:biopolymer transport protein ExbD
MITTTFAKTPGISLTLPQSSTAEPVQTTQLIITVISREEIYLNQDKYQFDGFLAMMSDYNKEQKEELKNVVIEGDENVSYKLLVEVLDVLRKNGIQGANLKTTVYRLEPPSQS